MIRSVSAIALMLAAGGWVCDSSDSDRCPGALSCASDIVDDCCPAGTPYRCEGKCSATPQCSDYVVCKYPDDPGSGLCTGGALQASEPTIACVPPPPMGQTYTATISGNLSGCGDTGVVLHWESTLQLMAVDCGGWTQVNEGTGLDVRCLPGGRVAHDAQWHLHFSRLLAPGITLSTTTTVTLDLSERPVIAQATLACSL